MAKVNVDYSEFETLKNRVKELEETVKEKDKIITSLKDGSKVIIRKETVILFEKPRTLWDDYEDDEPKRKTIETSESYIGFENVRLKVEEHMKEEVKRSIQQRDESRANYDSSIQIYKAKEKELEIKKKSFEDMYAQKEDDLISVYKKKKIALEADFLDKGKAYKRQLDADCKSRMTAISDSAKEALSRLNANRFFKPKGVESILAKIIQKCEQ